MCIKIIMQMEIYVRISTNKQQTDRQVVELKEYASKAGITITDDDIFTDIISGFKDGELRPQYSLLKQKIEAGEYQQILFSEFSRLDRKPSNLLRSIEYYQKHDVHLYFKKQNLWVKDKSDIASQIMISVLAVMSQYEIELFVARGIDGKISAIKNRGINDGGFTAYGYMTSTREKRLIINEAEAEIVRKIFVSFEEGKSSLDIADLLNSQGIPSPYSSRIRDSMEQRKAKGLPEKEYARISELDSLRWRPSTINRMIKNEIYIGKRNYTFYEPDPSNPKVAKARENRKTLTEFTVFEESLRIVEEALFYRVNEMMAQKRFNRNLGLKHDNLIKELLRCGECGSRFSVGGGTKCRKYKCYGTVCRADKQRTCLYGAELSMKRLDGLVLQLCISKFANYDISNTASVYITAAAQDKLEKEALIRKNEAILKTETDRFTAFVRRVLKSAVNDIEASSWIKIERETHDKRVMETTAIIERAKADILSLQKKINAFNKMKTKANIIARQEKIRNDRPLVKEYIRSLVNQITIYRISSTWMLVVVSFMDGAERWGTIKSSRYKKSEVVMDENNSEGCRYTSLFVNNDSKLLVFDKSSDLFLASPGSEFYNVDGPIDKSGRHVMDFEEFKAKAEMLHFTMNYPAYVYEDNEG